MSSPSRSPLGAPRQLSPSRRQHQLARRLASTRRPQPQAESSEGAGAKFCGDVASRKRPFPEVAPSSTSPVKTEQGDGATAVKAIGEYETWEEVSTILPLLSYGEESRELLASLLDLPASCDSVKADPGGSRCDNCNGERVDGERRRRILSNLSLSLGRILQARTVLQRDTSVGGSPVPKRKRPSGEKQRPTSSTEGSPFPEVLPWNVLLRVAIRMACYVAKKLNDPSGTRCECATAASSTVRAGDSKSRIIGDCESYEAVGKYASAMHSVTQLLDVVLADLHVLSRIQSQKPRGEGNGSIDASVPDQVGSALGTPTQDRESESLSPLRAQEPRKSQLPRDRMLSDWKSNNKGHLTNDFGRDVWGPSRYAFLTDVEFIASTLVPEAEGITVDEWREKVDSLVMALDKCVRVDRGHTPPREREQQRTVGLSPSLRRYGASPSKPASLASITRAHIERVGSRIKAERQSPKKESPLKAMKAHSVSGVAGVNLQSIMDNESSARSPEGDTDGLEDAYQLIMAFGTSKKGDSQVAQETIERRLTLLVNMVSTAENEHNRDAPNTDGAESYLESLLRMLVQPSDPSLWVQLMNHSDGKETPIMLRRGRALLVSFLVGIKAPGWKDHCCTKLQTSPVPSYLGYLSPREDFQAPRTKEKNEDVMNRTSYFLPAVDAGETGIPLAPIVTEVGLSLCVQNFFHGDASSGSSASRSGVSLFKGFGPLQYPASSTNRRDEIMSSIAVALPDTAELTRDLFDLTLRLAADDETDHEDKPISLRLVAPSASESLSIVLRVLTEHREWLCPHSVVLRYRFLLQHTVQAFLSSETSTAERANNDCDFGDDGFAPWSQRASHLIGMAKTSNRGRMVLYATQFMMLLCSSRKGDDQKAQQPTFYACLQLRQSRSFWDKIDRVAGGLSSNIVARVLDLEFCAGYLLPLSHHCALLLQQRESQQQNESSQSVLSLVTILCSVLDVLANNGFLHDCVHVGWAVQMLLFSVRQGAGNEMWNDVANQLERQTLANQQAEAMTGMLLPKFEVFAKSLIKFASGLHLSMDSSDVESFCRFIGNAAFDRYATALRSSSSPGSGHDLLLLSNWIEVLVSTLQEIAACERPHPGAKNGKSRGQKTDEEATERTLSHLMSPALRRLHWQIMQRALRSSPAGRGRQGRKDGVDETAPPEFVASIFVYLRQREEEKFLDKPSSAKTRQWSVYRKCLEKVFTSTPPATLLACPGQPALTQQSVNVLEDIWEQYGQSDLAHSASIMIAAALHVNRSGVAYLSSGALPTEAEGSSIELKRLYEAFLSQAKSCISSTFACFGAHDTNPQTVDGFDKLTLLVQRELANYGEADIGLAWWNQVIADLQSTLMKEASQDKGSKKTVAGSDIARACSTLEGKLTAISAASGPK